MADEVGERWFCPHNRWVDKPLQLQLPEGNLRVERPSFDGQVRLRHPQGLPRTLRRMSRSQRRSSRLEIPVPNGTLVASIFDQGDGASTGDGGQFRCPFSKDNVTGLAGASRMTRHRMESGTAAQDRRSERCRRSSRGRECCLAPGPLAAHFIALVGRVSKRSGWTQSRRRRHACSLNVIPPENVEHLISGCE